MSTIVYVKFSDLNPDDFLSVLIEERVREHLVTHDLFDSSSIKAWVKEKSQCDSMPGCRVRGILIDNALAGWCGIQNDDHHYELAIVISKQFSGFGISIYKVLMAWAKEFGHSEVVFHLLETRREYKFLKRMTTELRKTEMLGRSFATYHSPIEKWNKDESF